MAPVAAPTIAVSATSIVGSLSISTWCFNGRWVAGSHARGLGDHIYRLAFDQNQSRYGYGSAACCCCSWPRPSCPLQARRLRLQQDRAPAAASSGEGSMKIHRPAFCLLLPPPCGVAQFLLLTAYPLVWMVMTAFRTEGDASATAGVA